MRKIPPLLLGLALALGVTVRANAAAQDSPFAIRGMHVDMRTQVMTVSGLKALADKMAAAGMNTLIMEWEASLPFARNATLSNKYAYKTEEVKDFVAYCNRLGIDVIPLQNCFGHCEYILRHERYMALREDGRKHSQICPLSGKNADEVFESIFRDVIDLHTSKYIHIGADETRLLGNCKKCAEFVAGHGTSELFVQYVCRMCNIVTSLGKTPIIWGDIIAKHPEAVDKLPKDLIIMEWNYGWGLKRFGDIDRLIKSGLKVWGAPSLRSNPDNLYLVMWDKHLGNLENYVGFCKEKGFNGLIETSWSTSGEYGQIVDGGWVINDIQPIREVYPLAAFDLLQQAFFEACKPGPFDAHKFVRQYATEHYGLSGADIDSFEQYFYTTQNTVIGKAFNAGNIGKELTTFENLRAGFGAIKPSANKKDFEQLILMLDIRINYLRFQRVYAKFESKDFKISGKASLAAELKPVLKEGFALQKKFVRVNSETLKNPEAAFGDWSYLRKMENLFATLSI